MPRAVVFPAPIAYIKDVEVKRFIAELLSNKDSLLNVVTIECGMNNLMKLEMGTVIRLLSLKFLLCPDVINTFHYSDHSNLI